MTATFSISPKGTKMIDISAYIHAENGRIFSIEACSGRGSCHVFIEDDKEPTDEIVDGDVVILEESRAKGGNKTFNL